MLYDFYDQGPSGRWNDFAELAAALVKQKLYFEMDQASSVGKADTISVESNWGKIC